MSIQPSVMGGFSGNIDTMYQRVCNYLGNIGFSVRNSSLQSDLNNGEYRIAMKIVSAANTPGASDDYHFWRETTNSKWCNKHGTDINVEEITDTDNPSDIISMGWEAGYNSFGTYYYESALKIFAIK